MKRWKLQMLNIKDDKIFSAKRLNHKEMRSSKDQYKMGRSSSLVRTSA